MQIEHHGALEVTVEIDGCNVTKVPIDGSSVINLMLEDAAFDLRYSCFEEKNMVLSMADQSRVTSVERLARISSWIGNTIYLLNFIVILVDSGMPFRMLLGRPWLYTTMYKGP